MKPPKPTLPDKVRAAIQSGKAIEAIQLLRQARGIGLKEVKEIVAGVVAAAHLDGLGRFLPRAGNALEELCVGISEGIGDRLVEEVLLDPEVNGCPQEEVVSQPVVDDLVGVLVGNNQAQLVELEADAEVVLKPAMLQSLQEKKNYL